MQYSKCTKTFARADYLKKHDCKLVLDQETGCLSNSNQAAPDDVTTKQPTDKAPVHMLPGKTPRLDQPHTKKSGLKSSKKTLQTVPLTRT